MKARGGSPLFCLRPVLLTLSNTDARRYAVSIISLRVTRRPELRGGYVGRTHA